MEGRSRKLGGEGSGKRQIKSCFFEMVVSDKAMGWLRGYVIDWYVSLVPHSSLLFKFKLVANILKLVANI